MKTSVGGILLIPFAALAALAVFSGCRVSQKKSDSIRVVAASPEEVQQVFQSVRLFLAEIDKEDGQTWEHLAEIFKTTTSPTAWSITVASMKLACGKNLDRGKAQGVCTDELPDCPKGRYHLIEIPSKFERVDLTERVVLVLESGQWKVAGYSRKKTITFSEEAKKS